MIWLYVAGGVLLALAGVAPVVATRIGRARGSAAAAGIRAHDAMSRLEVALDTVPDSAGGRTEAARCLTLAGAALGGKDTAAKFAEAEKWALRGLAALAGER